MIQWAAYWLGQAIGGIAEFGQDLLGGSANRRSTGQAGESLAARYLQRQGLRIVGRGYRALGGEIDLIAVDRRVVVFVEVKTRSSDLAGRPEEAVDRDKQRNLARTAEAYLKEHELLDDPCRFDVVSILLAEEPEIEHFRHAFRLEDCE